MISNMSNYGDSTPSKVKLNSLNKKGRIEGVLMEVHEVSFSFSVSQVTNMFSIGRSPSTVCV